jgi:hypothetical protein
VQLVSEGVEFTVKFCVKCGEREVPDCVASRETVAIYITFPYITSYCVSVRQLALHERAVERELCTGLAIC